MNSDPLIELNPSEISDFKNLRKETVEQLETIREDLGRYYKLLNYTIKETSFTEFSRTTRSITNRGMIISDLEEKIKELDIIIKEETLTYNSIFYTFYVNNKFRDIDISSEN